MDSETKTSRYQATSHVLVGNERRLQTLHHIFPLQGADTAAILKNAKVLVVGAGGIGESKSHTETTDSCFVIFLS